MNKQTAQMHLKECFSGAQKKTNSNSLIKKWLGNPALTQAEVIAFGKRYEKWLSCIVSEKYEVLTLTKDLYITPEGQFTTKKKGNKDIDNLFIDHKNRIVYYHEVKCNLNLDSEKSKVTASKVRRIEEQLKGLYPGYDVRVSILNMAWEGTKKEMHGVPIKYAKDYFAMAGLDSLAWYNEMGKDLGKDYGR